MIPIKLVKEDFERAIQISRDVIGIVNYKHIQQIEAELAVCKLFDIQLNRNFNKDVFKRFDVTEYNDAINKIEVHYILHQQSNILLSTDDDDYRKKTLYIFVITEHKPTFIIKGWETGKKLLKPKYLKEFIDGSSRYEIPNSVLNPMEDLLAYKKVKKKDIVTTTTTTTSTETTTNTTTTTKKVK